MKKFLFLFVCMLWQLGAWAQFSGSGNGTAEDPYRIYTDIHLAQMANFLNQEGVVFELMKDIDLTDYIAENSPAQGWTPIGVNLSRFKGVFKGNNHTISGLYINRPDTWDVGLFGYIENAAIQDLTIIGNVKGFSKVGMAVGIAHSSKLSNIHIKGSGNKSIIGTRNVDGTYVGGLAGHVYLDAEIANCSVEDVYITGPMHVGGLVGEFTDGTSKMENCSVQATIESTDHWAGGMIGAINKTHCDVIQCEMHGKVTAANFGAGGCVGTIAAALVGLTPVNVVADIESGNYVGGLVGLNQVGSELWLVGSHHKGTITAHGDNVGGLVGIGESASIASVLNCSHFGDITGNEFVGGLIGKISVAEDEGKFYQSQSIETNTKYNSYSVSSYLDGTEEHPITNCTAIGNIKGTACVGGLIGYESKAYTVKFGTSGSRINLYSSYPCLYYGNKVIKFNNAGENIYVYPKFKECTVNLNNCYFSGNVSGTSYVGGIAGYKNCGKVEKCYSNAVITGETNVGGILGEAAGTTTFPLSIKSNVAINSNIFASERNIGRIFGNRADNVVVGAMASLEGNRALTQTSVMLCGVAQDVLDNEQNGTSVGPSMLRLKANYVSWGWNFDNDWNILETECYPYKKYQAAPPVIESNLESQATSISGSSLNGGTVYLYYKDRDAVSTTANEHAWSFATEPLQSGAQVQLYADVEGMTPSYFSSAMVKYPGSGTEADPYRIYTAEDLQGASNSGYYKLMNDIDLAQWIRENSPTTGWKPIGRNSTVATYINGDGHKVTGLWTNTTDNYTGLFSNYSAGYIKNLTVEVASGKKVKGGDFTGILIGRIANAQIINCSVKGDVESADNILGGVAGAAYNTQISHVNFEGTVTSTANGRSTGGIVGHTSGSVSNSSVYATINVTTTNGDYYDVGGIVGGLDSGGAVEKCRADVKIAESGPITEGTAGGLVGFAQKDSKISECYSSGTVTAQMQKTGGLVGAALSPISNCYSTVDVTGTQFTGGLVGYSFSTITNCYAKGNVNGVMYGAGLVGELDGENATANGVIAANNRLELTAQSAWGCRVIGGFKNGCAEPALGKNYALNTMQVSLNGVAQKKTDDNIEGVAKTAAELMSSSTYTALGWDFEKVWGIDEGKMYPFLLWEVDVNPVVEITLDKTTAVVAAGNTLTLTPNIQPLGATNKRLAWTSSNEGVATVEDGVVTAIAIGEATITATATDGSGVSAQCKVTVVANHDEAINQLRDDVDAALALYNNSTEGSNIGQYAAGSRAALLKVINEVRALISDTMDETAISNCSSKLAKAVADFKAQQVTGGADTDITLLDNVVYIEPVQTGTGRQLTLSVKMKNTKAFTGYKFDLYLPDGCTFATDEDGFPLAALSLERTTTAKTNYFDSSILGDPSTGSGQVRFLRVLCYSSKGYAFTGEDGEIATVTIDIPADMEAGDYALVLKDIELAVGDESYDTDYVKSTLTVTTYKLGDANDDGKIGVADLTAIASHILGSTPTHFVQAAADANEDGKIGVADLTCIASWILNGTASNRRAPAAVSMEGMRVEMSDFTIVPGGTAVVPVSINNGACLFSGYQFDVCLPEGFHVVSASLSDDRLNASAQTFDAALVDPSTGSGQVQTARVLCYSPKNTAFFGNTGVVAYLTIAADSDVATGLYSADLEGAELSYYGTSMTPAVQSGSICVALPTEISSIESAMGADVVYDISGRRVPSSLFPPTSSLLPPTSSLKKGLYIMNGKKIVK